MKKLFNQFCLILLPCLLISCGSLAGYQNNQSTFVNSMAKVGPTQTQTTDNAEMAKTAINTFTTSLGYTNVTEIPTTQIEVGRDTFKSYGFNNTASILQQELDRRNGVGSTNPQSAAVVAANTKDNEEMAANAITSFTSQLGHSNVSELSDEELSVGIKTFKSYGFNNTAGILQKEMDQRKGTENSTEIEAKSDVATTDDSEQTWSYSKTSETDDTENEKDTSSALADLSQYANKREATLAVLSEQEAKSTGSSTNYAAQNQIIASAGNSKIKNAEANADESNVINYKRSSVYTLMLDNKGRQHADVIRNTFGNYETPSKFNDHNIGPYLIDINYKAKDHSKNISSFLSQNDIAKKIISKWFNRDENGAFDMSLVAERGYYNATDLDVQLAQNNERGVNILADAGEELIGNTFIIVNDYKFTDKKEVAKKAGGFLKALSNVARVAGYSDVANVADVANVGTQVAGKGYVIKTTSYLYKLVWDEKTAATFYNEHWTDKENFDPSKAEAFNNATNYKLKYVGSQSAWADVQSSIFSSKSDVQLVERSSIKATDKALAKLERKYEIFRTKSPLLSGDPITAKIGLKEGLKKGDKFEVLEQVLDKNGKTTYKRVGIIKVDKSQIWDNRYMEHLEGENPNKYEYTLFSGKKNKYQAGMLIRQIN
ncbi:hypothetical protein ACFQ1Q_12335 [Winogradskyella litorisediminis]|uniref:Lipoprotein n=1 Tax=Winogradskyella litorisediminis TaxID=1156618 RepID=A0ABW3N985_9FLAO